MNLLVKEHDGLLIGIDSVDEAVLEPVKDGPGILANPGLLLLEMSIDP